jgi:hypothetical protein
MLEDKKLENALVFDPFTTPWILPSWHGRIVIAPVPLECRVWGRQWPVGGNCCLWTGWNNNKGHGIVRLKGKRIYLHRYSFASHHGVHWDSLDTIDHLCRNRPCFNPYHLEDQSQGVNYDRGDGVSWQYKKPEEYQQGGGGE